MIPTCLAAALAACGGGAGSAKPPETSAQPEWEPPPFPTDGAIGAVGLKGPDKPWEELEWADKKWFMIGNVHPVMQQVFETFPATADAFKEGGECAPCHGPEGKERKYAMPSDHLSALPPQDSQDFEAMVHSRMGKFMSERVTVAMAKLLGKEPFDPATGEGVSCFMCHPRE